MREFKIYASYKGGSLNEQNFMRELEERINSDTEIIERSKKCNQDFFEKVKEITSNPENACFIGTMIEGLKEKHPRYSYIKHINHDGKEFEVEIDELERVFHLIEL